MQPELHVSELRVSPSTKADSAIGLVAFASFLLNGAIRVDGVGIRRTADGRWTLSWPARDDRNGTRHPVIRPITDEVRRSIERQVFALLPAVGGDR